MFNKINLNRVSLTRFSQQEIRTLRFFVGVVVAIILAFGINWPFAFITPVFVIKFLGNDKPKIELKGLISIFLLVFCAVFLAGIATRILLPFPIVFILVMTLVIFWVSYWNNSGGNELIITMLLVGFTVIPMLGLLHQVAAQEFTIGFLCSCFVSLLITLIMHEVIPNKVSEQSIKNKIDKPFKDNPTKVHYALLSTLMIMPVIIFFFYFSLTSSVLVLAFIAILAQKPDLVTGVQGSKALLVGNSIGGIVAIFMYSLLLIAPNFIFLILLFALVTIIFAQLIFSGHKLAPLFAMVLTTVIIIISGATMGTADADEKFYTRILQIACACFYVIFATIMAEPWIKKISEL